MRSECGADDVRRRLQHARARRPRSGRAAGPAALGRVRVSVSEQSSRARPLSADARRKRRRVRLVPERQPIAGPQRAAVEPPIRLAGVSRGSRAPAAQRCRRRRQIRARAATTRAEPQHATRPRRRTACSAAAGRPSTRRPRTRRRSPPPTRSSSNSSSGPDQRHFERRGVRGRCRPARSPADATHGSIGPATGTPRPAIPTGRGPEPSSAARV